MKKVNLDKTSNDLLVNSIECNEPEFVSPSEKKIIDEYEIKIRKLNEEIACLQSINESTGRVIKTSLCYIIPMSLRNLLEHTVKKFNL